MSKPRKTVNLTYLVEEANVRFRDSYDEHVDGRQMLESFVSRILMDADAYAGYNYLRTEGARFVRIYGEYRWVRDGKVVDIDESRIYFYPPKVPVGTVVR